MALDTDVELHPVGGEPLTLAEQTQLFHLVAVVIDPYTDESAWLLRTAARILSELREADCRVAWLVTGPQEDALTFLGPWAEEYLTFADPERKAVEALGVEQIPSLVVVGTNQEIVGKADGWDPARWRPITDDLAKVLAWNRPAYPKPGDPVAFAGSPAAG
ncbi:MAG: hypothetical protein GY812_00040 [Actinomycetia bacterium]|nr:hypothetical protein [Actinomycetes bacterium]